MLTLAFHMVTSSYSGISKSIFTACSSPACRKYPGVPFWIYLPRSCHSPYDHHIFCFQEEQERLTISAHAWSEQQDQMRQLFRGRVPADNHWIPSNRNWVKHHYKINMKGWFIPLRQPVHISATLLHTVFRRILPYTLAESYWHTATHCPHPTHLSNQYVQSCLYQPQQHHVRNISHKPCTRYNFASYISGDETRMEEKFTTHRSTTHSQVFQSASKPGHSWPLEMVQWNYHIWIKLSHSDLCFFHNTRDSIQFHGNQFLLFRHLLLPGICCQGNCIHFRKPPLYA